MRTGRWPPPRTARRGERVAEHHGEVTSEEEHGEDLEIGLGGPERLLAEDADPDLGVERAPERHGHHQNGGRTERASHGRAEAFGVLDVQTSERRVERGRERGGRVHEHADEFARGGIPADRFDGSQPGKENGVDVGLERHREVQGKKRHSLDPEAPQDLAVEGELLDVDHTKRADDEDQRIATATIWTPRTARRRPPQSSVGMTKTATRNCHPS